MININDIKYRIVIVTEQGTALDVTDISHAAGWSEQSNELSAKITLKLGNADYNGQNITELVAPLTPVFVYANDVEVVRGTVQKYGLHATNEELLLNVEATDEVLALRRNQDEFYFSDGYSSSAILTEILNKWGVPFELQIQDVTHAKKVYRKKYLIEMIEDVLADIKEKGGGVYFVRAKEGTVQILPRGTNDPIYHFDIDDNLTTTSETFDISKIVTRVLIVAKSKEEGHQKIESVIEGKVELGTRQVIYERGDKTTLEEAETAAKKILEEQGAVDHCLSIEAPDIPTLRKGDRIRVRAPGNQAYYFIKSITHNALARQMKLELDEDNDMNGEAQTNRSSESNSTSPP